MHWTRPDSLSGVYPAQNRVNFPSEGTVATVNTCLASSDFTQYSMEYDLSEYSTCICRYGRLDS